MKHLLLIGLLLIHTNSVFAGNPATDELIETYQSQGAISASAKRGEQLWGKEFPGSGLYIKRSCASCHTNLLTNTGKHLRTGKSLQPLAPSVNKNSLSDKKKIEKWLKRNCKWTMGRQCTIQEKSDLLAFMRQQ